ncbi:hypothetical protein BROUX41_000615 [Berkeleyomyces rouxiae]|uniref:uncharacterized protein n=1 Tax=Berkeleyomyces rouxiae TaxID=2035830 RepID=UPI003B78F12F
MASIQPSTSPHINNPVASLPAVAAIPKLEPRRRRPVTNPLPRPATPAFPPLPDLAATEFQIPTRRILSDTDLKLFLASPTSSLIQAWIFGLTDAVAGVPRPAATAGDVNLSKPMAQIMSILEELEEIRQKTVPHHGTGSRFGNVEFRDFVDETEKQLMRWHKDLGLEKEEAITEVSAYLMNSFGHRLRLDYGSGHELNFMIWLLCLYELRVFDKSDFKSVVFSVFSRYLALMQNLQMSFYLEPAGSHGVWGLDDYQFLPFLFGASQLIDHPYIGPKAIHSDLTLEEHGNEYMYLSQVSFVNSIKTVKGLRWHSPMLDDISAAKSWSKIEGGMRRMFMAEVLGKLPVMQHFLFGSLIPATEGMSKDDGSDPDADSEDPSSSKSGAGGQCHDHGKESHKHGEAIGWNDCCGIKVPSGIAAGMEERKKKEGELRRIPFD